MDEQLNRLEAKIDALTAHIQTLEQKLDQGLVLPIAIAPSKKVTAAKNTYPDSNAALTHRMRFIQFGSQAMECQRKFNLKTIPHPNRVERYLRTNAPSAIDGLKRNDE